jgi:hypothetical protein
MLDPFCRCGPQNGSRPGLAPPSARWLPWQLGEVAGARRCGAAAPPSRRPAKPPPCQAAALPSNDRTVARRREPCQLGDLWQFSALRQLVALPGRSTARRRWIARDLMVARPRSAPNLRQFNALRQLVALPGRSTAKGRWIARDLMVARPRSAPNLRQFNALRQLVALPGRSTAKGRWIARDLMVARPGTAPNLRQFNALRQLVALPGRSTARRRWIARDRRRLVSHRSSGASGRNLGRLVSGGLLAARGPEPAAAGGAQTVCCRGPEARTGCSPSGLNPARTGCSPSGPNPARTACSPSSPNRL